MTSATPILAARRKTRCLAETPSGSFGGAAGWLQAVFANFRLIRLLTALAALRNRLNVLARGVPPKTEGRRVQRWTHA